MINLVNVAESNHRYDLTVGRAFDYSIEYTKESVAAPTSTFGTAGTVGTYTGCVGTAGTFGSSSSCGALCSGGE